MDAKLSQTLTITLNDEEIKELFTWMNRPGMVWPGNTVVDALYVELNAAVA